jgi:hypothetical protein
MRVVQTAVTGAPCSTKGKESESGATCRCEDASPLGDWLAAFTHTRLATPSGDDGAARLAPLTPCIRWVSAQGRRAPPHGEPWCRTHRRALDASTTKQAPAWRHAPGRSRPTGRGRTTSPALAVAPLSAHSAPWLRRRWRCRYARASPWSVQPRPPQVQTSFQGFGAAPQRRIRVSHSLTNTHVPFVPHLAM